MAIRIRINGVEMEADSTREAVDLYRQLSSFNGHKPSAATPQAKSPVEKSDETSVNDEQPEPLNENAKRTLRFLMQADSSGKPTKEVARAIGMEDARGMGAVNGVIRKWAKASFGLREDNIIFKKEEDTPDGAKVRYLRITEALRKHLREHAVEIFGEALP